jgi:hypothetical protein
MAFYTPSHSDLARHRKTKRFMRALDVGTVAAIGHLHLFWHWVLEFAPSGDISFDRFTCEDIADGALWEGDALPFLEALVTSGFVDREADRLAVHEWDTYGGKFQKKLAYDRERKRAKGKSADGDGLPTDILEPSNGIPRNSTEEDGAPRNSQRKEKEKEKEEKEGLTLAPVSARKSDPLWDAFVREMGSAPETQSERGAWNKAAKELRDVGATPEQVRQRCTEYRARWPKTDLTPPALARHWGALARPSPNGKGRSQQIDTLTQTVVTGRLARERAEREAAARNAEARGD